eukprot:TRINITY_DN7037_c0_g1_i1.p1 TRINITY_DN7037_c0_g1~~TRINITY_DN7037_c0_g1_i1.p1  ORF type:complete len:841 (-),score=260.30 TRINITY_DN7037_c0_g1_i1:78-2600(-)
MALYEPKKISDLMKEKAEKGEAFYSFEYFPPRTDQGLINLYARLERMARMKPLFMDVTWGAGGSTSDLTTEICLTIQKFINVNANMHLTCTNMPVEKFEAALKTAKENNMKNILALRGDPPRGQEWTKVEGGFENAIDLVKYIRKNYGDYFCISVAGYPEKHVDCESYELDLQNLKAKVDAGADLIITQLFYDIDAFFKFVKDCRDLGITVPILPGIMPIRNYGSLIRMCKLGGSNLPQSILDDLEPIKDDDRAVQQYGVKQCAEMCQKLLDGGVPGLHFYTLNLERMTKEVLMKLELVKPENLVRPLPWSGPGGRHKEDVRPIYWANRPRAYVSRTEDWDEYPNGRWGDSGSPSFSTLDDHHLLHNVIPEATRRKVWGEPKTEQDVFNVFVKYIEGKIDRLPWNDTALQAETGVILNQVVALNKLGFLTVNSQPRVNGASSSDKSFGWGPSGGTVYQKAYVEFFCSKDNFELLKKLMPKYPSLSFQAVNKAGEHEGNLTDVSAVTWGVWPSSEIKQPTIVDPNIFMNVWKDEAYGLWETSWGSLYEEGSESKKVISGIADSYYLVNIIDNNFIDGDIFSIFREASPEPITAHKIVFLRHGESVWNKEGKFTGWTDVDLSPVGVQEATLAGETLKKEGFVFDSAYTSVLKRAIRTLWITLETTGQYWIPVERSWRLNERHYGALQGLNKKETAAKHGDEQVHIWRRAYGIPPPALTEADDRYPGKDRKYASLTPSQTPKTECLKDTVDRVVPYWKNVIAPQVQSGKNILVAAHGNSLRALIKHLDNVSDDEIVSLNIPTAIPLVYEFDQDMKPIRHYYLADEDKVKAAQEAVANQGKADK